MACPQKRSDEYEDEATHCMWPANEAKTRSGSKTSKIQVERNQPHRTSYMSPKN